MSAENNNWGASSGPYDSTNNPQGAGNTVSQFVDYYPWVGTSTNHYILGDSSISTTTPCSLIYNYASSTYSSELSAAVSTWNQLNRIKISSSTTMANLTIFDVNRTDVDWLGLDWSEIAGRTENSQGTLRLNEALLSGSGTNEIQNTITHELGHALGLAHSGSVYSIMYPFQQSRTVLGPQDVSDYRNSLWTGVCQ